VDALNHTGIRIHGDIKANFGADYLRNNSQWLQ